MFISSSSSTLNPTLSASGTTSGNILSARAYPFPASLPLSTLHAPPHNQLSAPPSPYSRFPLGFRSFSPFELAAPMPSSGTGYPYTLTRIGIIDPSSQSSLSDSSRTDSPESTAHTGTSAGTSLPPSSASSSNLSVPTSLTSWPTTSGTLLTSSSATLPSPSLSLSTNSPSTSDYAPTSMTTLSSSITSATDASPSPAPETSYPSIFSSSSLVSSVFATAEGVSSAPDSATTVLVPTTVVTSVDPPSSPSGSPFASTYTITSFLPGHGGTTTNTFTSSVALSTDSSGSTLYRPVHVSPGAIAAIVLGILGTFAFAALWLFCARRRHRKLAQEAALVPPMNHNAGPLDDEILGLDDGYGIGSTHSTENATSQTRPTMEERYAGILAALHLTDRFGKGDGGGSTGGVYGSRHNIATDMDGDDDITRASSPTLPLHSIPSDDPPYSVLLSPPPPVSLPSHHQSLHPPPPPSAYIVASRRRSSPGPDAAAWLSGHSVAPSYSSHYARSQTLGSGSRSDSVDALTRTRTGSEEPLLGIGKVGSDITAGASILGGVSPTILSDPGSNKLGLGSAFGSPTTSMYSPSSAHPALQYDSSGSYDQQTASGSGSHGYARSGTPSSFNALRSVSSQGALSSAYSQGRNHSPGFKFGFGRAGSSSSGSTGKKGLSGRHSFGVPPTSFRAWKDRSSASSDKEKQGEKYSLKEKYSSERTRNPSVGSKLESLDEKQGRSSPVVGVRTLFERLRRGGHTPSPRSPSKELPSPTKASMDADPEKAGANQATLPPIQIYAATPKRRRFSFILSNPDPHPPSPSSGMVDKLPSSDASPWHGVPSTQHEPPSYNPHGPKPVPFTSGGLQPAFAFPTEMRLPAPSPAPTEESRLAEGLLHPRLRTQGYSDASLRDFEDYSRPIGGVVKNRLYSTTTFGTQDDTETKSRGTSVRDVTLGDGHGQGDIDDVFGAATPTGIFRGSWPYIPPSQSRNSSAGT